MFGREQQMMESKVGSGFYVKKVREDLSGEAMSKLKERSEEERGEEAEPVPQPGRGKALGDFQWPREVARSECR